MTRTLISLLLMTFGLTALAQKWYFGQNAGLDFSTLTPTAISGPISTGEGCSIVYDNSGQVLFSTDGSIVYDRNNNQLPNGTGLLGNSSATQSALIVPIPNTNCEKYFVFTVDAAEKSLANGFRYSVIDKSLNSGLGDIPPLQKNLIPPGMNSIRVAEKLTAVSNGSGGFWVVVHGFENSTNNNPPATSPGYRFYAFNIQNATMPSPVVSNIGSLHRMNTTGSYHYLDSQGQMKISHDGTKLALAVHLSKFVEIFNFSTATGVVSGPPYRINFPNLNECQVYGIEFSSNNNYLYVSTTYDFPNQSRVYQFDISAAYFSTFSPGTIWVKTYPTAPINDPPYVRQVSPNNYACQFGALQLGPDNNVYVASMLGNGSSVCNNSLDMINNANLPTAAFNQNYVLLSPGLCRRGLPTVIQGNFVCGGNNTCCPGVNLVVNGDFEGGNMGFTSHYMFQSTVSANSIVPGQYGIINGGQAATISPTWSSIQDPTSCSNSTGNFLVVNGENGGGPNPPPLSNSIPPSKLIWEQNVTVEDWSCYKFCLKAKNLNQCGFNVTPKIKIEFSMPFGDITQTVTAGTDPCLDWVDIEAHLNLWGYGTSLNIKIILDQTEFGDGNDLAIDNISLIKLDKCSDASTVFDFTTTTPHPTDPLAMMVEATAVITPPCDKFYWEVCKLDLTTLDCVASTKLGGIWTTNPTTFSGYVGDTSPSGSAPGIFERGAGNIYLITRGTWGECNCWNADSKYVGITKKGRVYKYTEKQFQANKDRIVRLITSN